MDNRGEKAHDHGDCLKKALGRAEAHCRKKGVRLTPIRRRVLELVWGGHRGVGAYEILEHLRRDGRNAAPPTVYRALDFLLAHGLVHRLESRNAYIGCCAADEHGAECFLICHACGTVAEIEDLRMSKAISCIANDTGFSIDRQFVEVEGVCQDCRNSL
jgi:Fur family transcriptional regulator, zinc uptake regulator